MVLVYFLYQISYSTLFIYLFLLLLFYTKCRNRYNTQHIPTTSDQSNTRFMLYLINKDLPTDVPLNPII